MYTQSKSVGNVNSFFLYLFKREKHLNGIYRHLFLALDAYGCLLVATDSYLIKWQMAGRRRCDLNQFLLPTKHTNTYTQLNLNCNFKCRRRVNYLKLLQSIGRQRRLATTKKREKKHVRQRKHKSQKPAISTSKRCDATRLRGTRH